MTRSERILFPGAGTVVLAGALLVGTAAADETRLEIESGVVFSARNVTRIPGNAGTTLSLSDELSTAPTPVFRLRAARRVGKRHVVSGLFAPLRLTARGSVERDVQFDGATYPAGSPLLAVYRFDSYRLTYRYSIAMRTGLEVAAGVTGKIRSAETSLYGQQARRKKNVGFVPLASIHVEWRSGGGNVGIVFNADALAAPQGRAEDILVAVSWKIQERIDLHAGYRMLEGGADNDEVYSFAWLHYVVAGVGVQL